MRALRVILAAAVYLAVASAITIAVAWALHYVHFQRLSGHGVTLELTGSPAAGNFTSREWNRLRWLPEGMAPTSEPAIHVIRQGGTGLTGWRGRSSLANVEQDTLTGPRRTHEMLSAFDAGWPMLALTHASHDAIDMDAPGYPTTSAEPAASLRYGLRMWRGGSPTTSAFARYALPLRPIWPGLLANTLLIGGVMVLLVHGHRPVRRLVRIRRGRCPACGYDRAGLEALTACPECGVTPTA